MPFDNENTFLKLKSQGKEEEFHRNYEKALKDVEKYLHKEYPNLSFTEMTEKDKIKDTSPIDESELATFQSASESSVKDTVKTLKAAYRKWYNIGYVERSRTILKCADEMSREKYLFAALLAYENGKNRFEAMGDVDEAIDFMRYYSLNLIENQGFVRFTGKAYKNEESMSVMKPYGVFAVIAPFNFFSITVGMTVGPLVVGNAVILKPSSDIPLSSYLFIKLLRDSGVPKDVVAYLAGSGSVVGRILSSDSNIAGIVFTGSRETGLEIYHNATKDEPKVVVTEMGGKDAIIVTNKASLEKAVEGVVRAAFGYSGQKCSACSLLFVQEGIYDKFLKMLVDRTKSMTPKDPREKDAFVTPVVNRSAYEKFKEFASKLPHEGKVVCGGKTVDRKGYYVEPTIVTDLKKDSFAVKNELFVPILSVLKFRTLEEAVAQINDSRYGLTGGIFSEDPAEIEYYMDNADVGVLYANRSSGGSTGAMVGSQPFVGWKLSGSSGKGTGSFYYLQQFLREQSQTVVH